MKVKVISVAVWIVVMSQSITAQTNEGTEFWFGFMEHFDIGENTMVAMITSKHNTSGVISMPLQGWSTSFNVTANGVQIITLPRAAETRGTEAIQNNGIQVTTNLPSSVYIHQYHTFRAEAAVILPLESIGREYYVMSFEGYQDMANVDHRSEFLIVGTQDETTVTINLADRTRGGKSEGTTFSVVLDEGETYQVQARAFNDDLTGTFISGDKDFVVLAGNTWTEVPVGCSTRDNLLEQMYPVTAWGEIFVTVPNDRVAFDLFRILASEDNTMVTVDNGTSTRNYTLNAGEFAQYNEGRATFIEATKPILVAQYNTGRFCNNHPGGIGDPSMVLLNSVIQTRDTVTLYNSAFENIDENFINVIVQTRDTANVIFDGQPLIDQNVNFGSVGPNNNFSYARIRVSTGAHTIISEGCGVIATAYGYGDAESYAYSGGASFSSINANPIPEGGCLNDTILFDTGLNPKRYDFFWELGDGTTTTAAKFSHFYDDLGVYPVTLIVTDNCLNTIDTSYRDLMVTLRQAVDTDPFQRICEGEPLFLSATDLAGARYEWIGPKGTFLEEQFPTIMNTSPDKSGTFEVIGIVSGCATFPAFHEVEIVPTPTPNLGPDTIFCVRNNTFNELNPGAFSSYRWQDGSSVPIYQVEEEGIYAVEVTDEFGCIGVDSVALRSVCPTAIYIPNAFSPNGDGENDQFGILGADIISAELSIFDRWGSLIYYTSDYERHWDGNWQGQEMSEGVYLWVANIEGYREDGQLFTEIKTGTVTLLR